MTSLTIAGRLTAADDRRLKGWLLPFGAPGYTNMGKVTVPDAAAVTVPADISALFASLDHLDARDPVATWAHLEARPEGLWAEWDVPLTHGGDKLLAEFRAGKRTGISVELEPVTVTNGTVTGTLIGCAFPERPAFDGARLVAALAVDALPAPDGAAPTVPPMTAAQLEALAAYVAAGNPALTADDIALEVDRLAHTLDAAGAEAPADIPPADTIGDTVTTATAPAGLLTAAAPPAAPPAAPAVPAAPGAGSRLLAANASMHDVFRLLAAAHANPGQRGRLLAALEDIVPADTLSRDQPQWLGEVWSGNAYQRRVVPLLTGAELTDLRVRGWKWNVRPTMAKYAGSKAPIPSSPVSTIAYEDEAQRFAGGNDFDIKYKHFRDVAFFASWAQAMSESYAKLTDAYAVETMKLEAQTSTLGSVPSGVPVGWVAVVDAALDVIDVGTPSFALIEKSVYRDMFLTGTDKFLEFLNASMDFESGTLNSSNFRLIPVAPTSTADETSALGLDRGEVIVGTRAAVKFRELGGGTPIRADALDLVNGGTDEAMFGYAHCGVEDARGLRRIDTDADSA